MSLIAEHRNLGDHRATLRQAWREEPLLLPLGLLTLVTGLVDAACYLGLGRVFTANMTGNVVLLGFGAAKAQGLPVLAPTVSLVVFLAGATVGGRLAADSRLAGGRSPRAGRRVAAVALIATGALAGALLLQIDVAVPVLAAAMVIALATVSLRMDRTPPDATSRRGPEHATGPAGTS